MLEALNKISWSKLKHAYGFASDVPKQIRDLADPHLGVRGPALSELYGNIFHQGTRYQATPFAVPFLYEIATSEKCTGRPDVVYLLVNLALGYEESHLPDGLNVAEFRSNLEESDREMSASDRKQCDKYGVGPRHDLDSYDAVRRGVPLLIELSDADDLLLSRAAIYALAWFPEDVTQSLPSIQKVLNSRTDDFDVANAILSIGLLARSSDAIFDQVSIQEFLSHGSLIVRVAAAIALARDPLQDSIIDILISAIALTKELQGLGDEIHFNEGNIAGYASLVLARHGMSVRERIIPALCETLKSVKRYPSMDITNAILKLVLAGKTLPLADASADALDQLEYEALQAIAQYGGWKIGKAIFGNYSELIRSYGLPDSQEKLVEFLNAHPR